MSAGPPVSCIVPPCATGELLLAVATGGVFTTITVGLLSEHPFASVTVNVYVPAAAGLTVGFCKLLVYPLGPLHE
jgi:hypothetical protein